MKIAGYTILGLAVIGFFTWALMTPPIQAPATVESKAIDLGITSTDWKRGSTSDKVVFVEYGDFQCPACGAYEPLVEQAQAEFGTQVQFIFRHFPLTQLHQNALLAAKASEAAGKQGKFWEMHDLLYKNQSAWSESDTAESIFAGYAVTLGLDKVLFEKDITDVAIAKKIQDSYNTGDKFGVSGTPTFFINGKKLDNPHSYAELSGLIKKEIDTVATATSTAK